VTPCPLQGGVPVPKSQQCQSETRDARARVQSEPPTAEVVEDGQVDESLPIGDRRLHERKQRSARPGRRIGDDERRVEKKERPECGRCVAGNNPGAVRAILAVLDPQPDQQERCEEPRRLLDTAGDTERDRPNPSRDGVFEMDAVAVPSVHGDQHERDE